MLSLFKQKIVSNSKPLVVWKKNDCERLPRRAWEKPLWSQLWACLTSHRLISLAVFAGCYCQQLIRQSALVSLKFGVASDATCFQRYEGFLLWIVDSSSANYTPLLSIFPKIQINLNEHGFSCAVAKRFRQLFTHRYGGVWETSPRGLCVN